MATVAPIWFSHTASRLYVAYNNGQNGFYAPTGFTFYGTIPDDAIHPFRENSTRIR